uniref:Cytochrome c554 and c-prime n=1 Tax=Candidatus Kentrum sp. TC TaxID=2126339 RepID=A0A450Y9Z3_9GAMM|nr:MAG: Cytochrome c554 and c-prime [Candidatus Kentron sp. TC]
MIISRRNIRSMPSLFASPVTPGLKRLLAVVFALFAILGVNALYLSGVTALEWMTGRVLQDHFYQIMFLLHLAVGFIAIIPVAAFGALHGRRARRLPNRRAARAGLGLLATALALLASGVALTRLGVFELKDPRAREAIYWLHVAAPLVAIWLFVLHRLAGAGLRWGAGALRTGGALALFLLVFLLTRISFSEGEAFAPASVAEGSFPEGALAPSLAKTADGKPIPARLLMMGAYCKDCHADVHEQWSGSAHALSSFNNPAYLFSVRETRAFSKETTGSDQGARFCAGCHDPAPLFSGAFDDPDFDDVKHPTANAGITCTACHAITRIDSPRGNADYTIEAPRHYPFTHSENPFLRWVNHRLVKAKPAFHRVTFLKPLHREPEFCGACHKVHIPRSVNDYKWLRGQNHYDAYHLSGVSGHGAMSFYYPPKAIHRCSACHMPSTPSDDFGSAFLNDSARLQVHDHGFAAANTALPHLLGFPEGVRARERFLKGALRLDIFGIKEEGRITGRLTAPLRPEVPALEAGKRYLLEVVIRNLRVGHLFTQGTSDSNQVWLDVQAESGGRVIGRSGGMDPEDGEVDPWSHFVNAYLLDREGNRIERRNGQDIFTKLYDHQIPPGAADVAHFALEVPEDVADSVTVRVGLRYRKFDTTYLRHFQGERFTGNDLPVVTIAEDRIVFPARMSSGIEVGDRSHGGSSVSIPDWERWNDYGIGLLGKGSKGSSKGELRQAEQAFMEVERLGRADGPLNLARVYWKEGRLVDAGEALRRAAGHASPVSPWVVAWFSGLVNKQNGFLDEAITDFRRVLDTDFPEARAREFDFSQDYRVRNELGQTLFERAKRERGPKRREARELFLGRAREEFRKTLTLDPENVTAHYNLALIHGWLGEPELAAVHRKAHMKYKPDDNARERAVAIHRRANPAADHAAESVVIYDLRRAGAYGSNGE